jgi:monoamine oxidase
MARFPQSFPAEPDVVVIGAGAAGVAALRALRAAGRSAVGLEARERAGGRAWTISAGPEGHPAFPLDLGCGWLHSADRNPLVGEARALGLAIDETPPPWRSQRQGESFAPGEQEAFRAAQARFYARLEAAAQAGEEGPADRLLEQGERWNPLIDAVSTYVNGTELARLSVRDFDAYQDTEINFRVAEGYGALIERLATDLPIAYGCAARRIDHSGARVAVETEAGAIHARAVVVALPTNLLATGALRFAPDLPDKTQAAAHLPLGVADKLFLHVEGAEDLPENARLFGRTDRVDTGAYHYRPFGRPLIEGYFGGACARALEEGGMAAFADFAIAEICDALGARWRNRLTPVACSAWARDPFALGSYSHALPGHWDARATLAAPVDGRLFFAGEATHAFFFSTAHGAWMSGLRAAQEALDAISAP